MTAEIFDKLHDVLDTAASALSEAITKEQASAIQIPNVVASYRADLARVVAAKSALGKQQAQAPDTFETIYQTILQWDEGGKRSRRELARRIVAIFDKPVPPLHDLSDDELFAAAFNFDCGTQHENERWVLCGPSQLRELANEILTKARERS